MNLSLHTLPTVMARHLGGILEAKAMNTGDIELRWNSAALPADPNLEAQAVAPVRQTATVRALIHYVSVRTAMRGLTEFKAGDAIVTFDGDLNLAGRQGLTFGMPDGAEYVQAATGKDVAEFWDVIVGGTRLSVTLLLRAKT